MARCETFLVLTSEEVNARIPYALVCMTRFGAHWGNRPPPSPLAGRVYGAGTDGGHPAVQSVPPLAADHRGPRYGADDSTNLRPVDEAGRVLRLDLMGWDDGKQHHRKSGGHTPICLGMRRL